MRVYVITTFSRNTKLSNSSDKPESHGTLISRVGVEYSAIYNFMSSVRFNDSTVSFILLYSPSQDEGKGVTILKLVQHTLLGNPALIAKRLEVNWPTNTNMRMRHSVKIQ